MINKKQVNEDTMYGLEEKMNEKHESTLYYLGYLGT